LPCGEKDSFAVGRGVCALGAVRGGRGGEESKATGCAPGKKGVMGYSGARRPDFSRKKKGGGGDGSSKEHVVQRALELVAGDSEFKEKGQQGKGGPAQELQGNPGL